MLSTNIDLGQLILATLIGLVGWFLKKEINEFKTRLDEHEKGFFKLAGDVQRLIGQYEERARWDGYNRRQS